MKITDITTPTDHYIHISSKTAKQEGYLAQNPFRYSLTASSARSALTLSSSSCSPELALAICFPVRLALSIHSYLNERIMYLVYEDR